MTSINFSFSNTFFVFDLDDTLYKEFDYLLSGLNEVVETIQLLYGINAYNLLNDLLIQGNDNIITSLCNELNFNNSIKQALIWKYRLHLPRISLDENTKLTLYKLMEISAGLAVLTDGRSITQRLKLKALNLDYIPAYISEEFNDEKPSYFRFQKIEQDYSATKYVYIGDNPKKDFIAPNNLGWITIGLKGDKRNIHSQNCDDLPTQNIPDLWITSFSELLTLNNLNNQY